MDGQITWKRVSDSDFPNHTFWGPAGDITAINPQDINQGYIGNCWIMSALSAIAEVPSRVDNLFVQNGISDKGIYALRMYGLGVPFTQIIDDYLPLVGGEHIFGGLGKDGSIWGSIVEKAFAKRYGNYEHLVGGWMSAAVSIVNGSPWEEFDHINITKEALWTKLRLFDSRNDVLTAGSWFCNQGPTD